MKTEVRQAEVALQPGESYVSIRGPGLQRELGGAFHGYPGLLPVPGDVAAAAADWTQQPDFYQIVTDAPGENAWPIAGVVFVLVPREAKDPAALKAALAFFRWALNEGQADADAEHYVSLPPVLVRQIEAYWDENIK